MIITSKYESHCKKCHKQIAVGDRVNWDPATRKGVTCLACEPPMPGSPPARANGTVSAPAARPEDLWLAVLVAAEHAVIENALRAPKLSPELEASWDRYQKVKALALAPGTPEEGKVALRRALLDVIKMAV